MLVSGRWAVLSVRDWRNRPMCKSALVALRKALLSTVVWMISSMLGVASSSDLCQNQPRLGICSNPQPAPRTPHQVGQCRPGTTRISNECASDEVLSRVIRQSAGMSVVPVTSEITTLVVSGKIQYGDYYKFERLADLVQSSPPRIVVVLSGPGGSLNDGLAIGSLIHARRYETAAILECDSSCAFAWAGGERRWINPRGIVGVPLPIHG
jgi:hypothetical protein